MQNNLIYGVVEKNIFYSNKMEVKLKNIDNGIYSMDMSSCDFLETISPADIDAARKFFKKASKITIVRGISFHDGIIPENPVSHTKIPIKVSDPTFDEFEEIEVVIVRGVVCCYLKSLSSVKAYPLMELRQALDSKELIDISKVKDVTPEMRLVYTFHLIEKKKKEDEEPIAFIKRNMASCGAIVEFVKKNNLGYEVQWAANGYTINTLLNKDFRVREAGFCTSGYDNTQSVGSVVHLLKDYADRRVSRGDYVNIMRTTR
jgi:hypothetical protein